MFDKLKSLFLRKPPLDEHEDLTKRYCALKNEALGNAGPTPKCVRVEEETWSYFDMSDSSRISDFRKFLRDSGHWTRSENVEIRWGLTPNNLEPSVWFDNEKSRHVDIPFGCVFLVKDSSPKTDWLVITEERFEKHWRRL